MVQHGQGMLPAIRQLAHSRHLKLRSLDLGGNGITMRGAAILANSELASSLTFLGLRSNYLGSGAVRALTESDKLSTEMSLDVRNNRLSDEEANMLRDRFRKVKL